MHISSRVAAALCLIVTASVESLGIFFTARSLVDVPSLRPLNQGGFTSAADAHRKNVVHAR